MLTDIRSLLPDELTAVCKEMGLPAFRAKQIFRWLHVDCVETFDEMTNLSLDLRNELKQKSVIFSIFLKSS